MIELNADIGEGCDDAPLLPYVGRVSIACGGHAGDATTMRRALTAAAAHNVQIGAHPSYPDRANFGRVAVRATGAEIEGWVRAQVEALADEAATLGLNLAHVKPHGALYAVAARDEAVALAVVRGVASVDASLAVVALSGSSLAAVARAAGLAVLREAFADRRYRGDGSLVSRETPGAVLDDPALAATQACAIARGTPVLAVQGEAVRIVADTLCVHGDTPHALAIVRATHAALSTL